MVDLTHEVIPFQIAQAAFLLGESWPYFPEGSIHVVVVDPGVGTARRPILAEAGGQYFIGPDNGVFSMLEAGAVREILVSEKPASNTFHGRDVFAPTAARLASGAGLEELGKLVTDPVRLKFDPGMVLHIDHFGNVITGFRPTPGLKIRTGFESIEKFASTFGEMPPNELFLIEGSSGYVEIALNRGSAAERLGLNVGDILDASH